MPFLLRNLTLNPGEGEGTLRPLVALKIGVRESEITSFALVRKGVDARKKGRIKLEIGLAKGKKQFDKREVEKERDWAREKQQLMKRNKAAA